MLISKVGQAAWIICLEEVFCAEPGTGKAVAGLSSGLAHEMGGVLAMAAWALGSTGALWWCQGWVVFQLWMWRRKVNQSGNYSAHLSQWNGCLFQNTLQAGKVFWLFSVDIPSSALPSDSFTWDPARGPNGPEEQHHQWVQPVLSLVTHGCHWSPWLSPAPPNPSCSVSSWRCCSVWGLCRARGAS